MSKRAWSIFFVVQIVGEICYWIWPLLPSPISMWLWGTYMIFLCPGNFVASEAVEAIFWNKLTLTQMSLIEIPIKLGINALLWTACIYSLKRIYSILKK